MTILHKLIAVLLFLLFSVPILAQESSTEFPDGLEASFVSEHHQTEFFYPESWTLKVITNDGAVFNIYSLESDLDSQELPMGVEIRVSSIPKNYQDIDEGSVPDILPFLIDVPDDEDLELYETSDTKISMVRHDTTQDDLPVAVILADSGSSDEDWLVIRIWNYDDPIVDTFLQNITSLRKQPIDAYCPSETDETLLSVILVSTNDKGLSVLKAVRTITELDLDATKEIVGAVPEGVVLADVDMTTAVDAKTQLELEGATIELWAGEMIYDPSLCTEDGMASGSGLYNVVITEIGDKKINVIKAVRSVTTLGLAEAKDVVEDAPNGVVLSGVSLEAAEAAKATLEAEGATVILEEQP